MKRIAYILFFILLVILIPFGIQQLIRYRQLPDSITIATGLEGGRYKIIAKALGDALGLTKAPLSILTLNINKISDAGAAAIGEALKVSKAPLAQLWLYGNSIGDAGAAAIAEGLKVTNAPLTKLWLERNCISQPAKASLRAAAKAVPSLTDLDL